VAGVIRLVVVVVVVVAADGAVLLWHAPNMNEPAAIHSHALRYRFMSLQP
jgi:hypothetical protein